MAAAKQLTEQPAYVMPREEDALFRVQAPMAYAPKSTLKRVFQHSMGDESVGIGMAFAYYYNFVLPTLSNLRPADTPVGILCAVCNNGHPMRNLNPSEQAQSLMCSACTAEAKKASVTCSNCSFHLCPQCSRTRTEQPLKLAGKPGMLVVVPYDVKTADFKPLLARFPTVCLKNAPGQETGLLHRPLPCSVLRADSQTGQCTGLFDVPTILGALWFHSEFAKDRGSDDGTRKRQEVMLFMNQLLTLVHSNPHTDQAVCIISAPSVPWSVAQLDAIQAILPQFL
jgi:hypothetical protein